MALTKQELASRRQAIVGGIIVGVVLYATIHGALYHSARGSQPLVHNTFFFGDTADWPSFVRSFWPLDVLVACACSIVTLYLLFRAGDRSHRGDPDPEGFKEWIKWSLWTILGYALAFGSFMGLIGCCMAGWALGIELFALFTMGAGVVFGALFTLLFGGGALVVTAADWAQDRWDGSSLQQKFNQKSRPVAEPLGRLNHYLSGGDTPDDTDTSDHPSPPPS